MQLSICLVAFILFGLGNCSVEEERLFGADFGEPLATGHGRQKEELLRAAHGKHRESSDRTEEQASREEERKEHHEKKRPSGFKLSEHAQKELLKSKPNEDLLYKTMTDFFLKNPNTMADRECFAKFKSGESIDFVVDLAPSPTTDRTDKMLAECPIALLLEGVYQSPSRAYFEAVQLFIDYVTLDMKPEVCHSVIYENGRKFFLRGRSVEDVESIQKMRSGSEFEDMSRNLKTLWPVSTKEVDSRLGSLVKNNLGSMTKQVLWNRDNGLPVVLNGSRRSKPIYTVVISDGFSGAKINDLTEDLSRTMVIDVGNRRFVNSIDRTDLLKLSNVLTLVAPQQLPFLADTVRNMVCCHCLGEEQSRSQF